MGGRGAFMEKGGFTVYDFEAVRYVEGIKVLEPKKKDDSFKAPVRSNTPSTSYIRVAKDGKSAMLRVYGQDRFPLIDYEYGKHKDGKKTWHVQTWKDGVRQEDHRPMTTKEKKRYARLFKKAGLKL